MSRLDYIHNTLQRMQGVRANIKKSITSTRRALKEEKLHLKYLEEAKEVIRGIGLHTQQQLQFHISDITSIALESVFDDAYRLEIEFIQRRNKTECDVYFVRGEHRINPLLASGGGAVDIAAFALRIALWSLSSRLSNVIILDEPMRFVSEDLREKASSMIKEVSKKLDIQFIIVTHDPALTAYADEVHKVTLQKEKEKKISKVSSYNAHNINSF